MNHFFVHSLFRACSTYFYKILSSDNNSVCFQEALHEFVFKNKSDPLALTTGLDIDLQKRLELPVCEEMQMGMTNGLALQGMVPVSIFPRWNFLMCAVNQLVNHLDKIKEMSDGQFIPKAIIRTAIGSERPLHPQSQHVGDFSDAVQTMCSTVEVIRLEEPEDIFPAYQKAFLRDDRRTTICVEYGDHYNQK